MPAVELRNGLTPEDTIAKLKKTLGWLLANLDHWNVRRLYTEYCKIQSENGETEIEGPRIIMSDGSSIRLVMGLNKATGKFVFELYNPSGQKTVYLDDDGTEVLDGKLNITSDGKLLLEAFKDTNGGKIAIYDINGNTNVRIGSEGAGGDNVGGVIQLFNDSASKRRVSLGIHGTYDSGIAILHDKNNLSRVYITGEQSGQASIFIYDSAGNLKSRLSESTGVINGETIATQDWVNSQGFIKYTSGYTGEITVGEQTLTFENGLLKSVS